MFANPGVIATTGLLAAMAIPAFQKVRSASQEKAVINNLRMLAAGADQYFLETGKNECTYRDIVGTGSEKYIREINPVAGEDYTGLTFQKDQTQLTVTLPGGKPVTWDWKK
jgi:type IV pilus assembly protein PilA